MVTSQKIHHNELIRKKVEIGLVNEKCAKIYLSFVKLCTQMKVKLEFL